MQALRQVRATQVLVGLRDQSRLPAPCACRLTDAGVSENTTDNLLTGERAHCVRVLAPSERARCLSSGHQGCVLPALLACLQPRARHVLTTWSHVVRVCLQSVSSTQPTATHLNSQGRHALKLICRESADSPPPPTTKSNPSTKQSLNQKQHS